MSASAPKALSVLTTVRRLPEVQLAERTRRNLLDLTLEVSAVVAMLGHGFHPLKARQSRSISNLQSVHRQGRTPLPGLNSNGSSPAAIDIE